MYWRQSRVPGREDWIRAVSDIGEAERWVATCRDRHDRHMTAWAPWTDYVSDPVFVPSSLDVALLELAEPSLKTRRLQAIAGEQLDPPALG